MEDKIFPLTLMSSVYLFIFAYGYLIAISNELSLFGYCFVFIGMCVINYFFYFVFFQILNFKE